MGIIGSWEGYADSPLYLLNGRTWSNLQTPGFTLTSGNFISPDRYQECYNFDGIARLNQTVNLSNYKYLKGELQGLRAGGENYNVILGVSKSANLTTNSFVASYTKYEGTFIVDVSGLTGDYYIYVSGPVNSGGVALVYTLYLTTV